jgi:hypothetical protein
MRFTFYSLLGGFIGTTSPIYISNGKQAPEIALSDIRYTNETWNDKNPFGIDK